MCKALYRLVVFGLVLAATALAGTMEPNAALAQTCGIGFRCCPRLGQCLCWPDHEICP